MDDGMTHDNTKTGFDISIRRPPSTKRFTAELMLGFFIPGFILGNRVLFSHPSHNPRLQGTIVMATANHLECGPAGCGSEFLNGLWRLPGETEPWAQRGALKAEILHPGCHTWRKFYRRLSERICKGKCAFKRSLSEIWQGDQDSDMEQSCSVSSWSALFSSNGCLTVHYPTYYTGT